MTDSFELCFYIVARKPHLSSVQRRDVERGCTPVRKSAEEVERLGVDDYTNRDRMVCYWKRLFGKRVLIAKNAFLNCVGTANDMMM